MWWCNNSAPSRQWIRHLPRLWVLHWPFHILPEDEKQRAQVTAGVFMGHSLVLNLDWQGNPYGNSRSSLRSLRTLCPGLQEGGESVAVSWGQASAADLVWVVVWPDLGFRGRLSLSQSLLFLSLSSTLWCFLASMKHRSPRALPTKVSPWDLAVAWRWILSEDWSVVLA